MSPETPYPHNTFIKPDKSENLTSNVSSIQTQIMLRDSPPLVMFDGMVSDASHYNSFESPSPQLCSRAGVSPWSPLSETVQERTVFGHNSDQCYTSVPIEASYQSLEERGPTKRGPCTQGFYQDKPSPTSHPGVPEIYGFQSDHDLPQTSFTRPPILPLPIGASHRRSWNDSDVANTRNEIIAPWPRHSHIFQFDMEDASGPSLYSPALNVQAEPSFAMKLRYQNMDDTLTLGSCETDSESAKGEPPYAKLIYNALMNAREHKLVLRDIYAWIHDNTDKAKDPAFKGWQNSVRHNLSMNGAFVKVPHVDPTNKHKKGFIWVLDPAAVGKGIESTTRYRQKTVGKRSDNPDLLDPKRQRSGRKGGRATRKSAKLKRSARMDDGNPNDAYYLPSRVSEYCHESPEWDYQSISPDLHHYGLGSLPYYTDPPSSESPHPEDSPYSYPSTTVHAGLPADLNVLGNSFDIHSALFGNKAEDLFCGHDHTAFV